MAHVYQVYVCGTDDTVVVGLLDTLQGEGIVLRYVKPTPLVYFVASFRETVDLYDSVARRLPRVPLSQRHPIGGPWIVVNPVDPDNLAGVVPPKVKGLWKWIRDADEEQQAGRKAVT